MSNKNIFLPTKQNLTRFINENDIPNTFFFGDSEDEQLGFLVATILKNNENFDFIANFEKAYNHLEEHNMAIKYYTPQLYQRILNITNEEWLRILQNPTGLNMISNMALYESKKQDAFNENIKQEIETLQTNKDFYPDTGVIVLEHLKTSK